MSDMFLTHNLVSNRHVDGFEFLSPKGDFTSIHLAHEGDYERNVRIPLLHDAKRAVNAVDVGANIGLIGLPLSRAISGRLFCFEMSERNSRILLMNAVRNNCTNITVFPFAIGDRLDSRAIQLSSHTTLNTMLSEASSDFLGDDVRVVPTVTLDMLFGSGPKIDLLKIDVDGWDLQALRGGLGMISRDQPIVYTEFCPKLIRQATGESEEEYLALLLARGYRPEVIGPNLPYTEPQGQTLGDLHAELCALLQRVEHLQQTHIDLRWSIKGLHGPCYRE